MSASHYENRTELLADEQLEKVVTEIAARNFPSPSSGNTYIGFQLRCGRLKRELRAYLSIYREHFDCYPSHDHLVAVGECIYPVFEKRDDWQSLSSPRTETLVVEEMRFSQIRQMADLHLSLLSTLE